MGTLDGRVAVITGAGRGIGREHALLFAREGAKVVVNDLGGAEDGSGSDAGPAQQVVDEIKALGGEAVANTDSCADWEGGQRLIQTAIDTFGELHVLVNNAGILRDKMFVNMDVQMWDDVMRVHLRGTFCPTRHAVDHWRTRHKAGDPVDEPRIVNTSSPSGLYGNVGQTNYGAAKAAIAGFTVILADELARLGVTVNAIAPSALTQMTAGLDAYVQKVAEIKERTGFDTGSPANISPLVVWLASPEAAHITGRVFNVKGGRISVAETWVAGPYVEKEARWETTELGAVIPELVAAARSNSDGSGTPRSAR
jgi:NAD(P)-dependent dehydrogenase (short-subunit alcohol dehydrogenase family)